MIVRFACEEGDCDGVYLMDISQTLWCGSYSFISTCHEICYAICYDLSTNLSVLVGVNHRKYNWL